ncbi:HNH endonuclease [Candidatus Nomurabacteria bacterium]|nr:HNH endonuclease [Candidatus Kaiserbacteria bacterium]MCB9814782.1 HNH endonuclease [Candidatus Nomurabacteria bacterium]
MSRKKKWSNDDLKKAVKSSYSVREVIKVLGLVPAGGNYVQIKQNIEELNLNTTHFTGKGWRKNRIFSFLPKSELSEILVKGSKCQSYKLKHRLFYEGLMKPECEICGWAEQAEDGRIPVELDHINGDRLDNRLKNLRILCPNCHSLQSTHRGMNQKRRMIK